jgi:L-malate glycosyltransferase
VKVLYVNHTATVSGGEHSLLSLLGGLPASVQARVACPAGALQREAEQLPVPVSRIVGTAGSLRLHPLHTPQALAEIALAGVQVGRLARRYGSEVVHANSIRSGLIVGLSPAMRAASVVYVRDCLPRALLANATLRLIAATATVVVANSRYTARAVEDAAPNARVEVVHSPVDLARWDPARIDRARARARLGRAGERSMLLGVVAQLTAWKGQDTAIEALRALRAEGVDAHLLLIGSAKFVDRSTRLDNQAYVARLHELVERAGLKERVSWLGERDDVPELVRTLDALLLPSSEEPFGRVLIEAMALEVPVLATEVGGPKEIVEHGREGYLLPPREPGAWAAAIAGLAADPERARAMGRAGRARVEQAFGVRDHVAAMLAVYERALAYDVDQ